MLAATSQKDKYIPPREKVTYHNITTGWEKMVEKLSEHLLNHAALDLLRPVMCYNENKNHARLNEASAGGGGKPAAGAGV
jgi:hypothetical protein